MFSDLYIKLIEGKTVLSLVGLGYVGMPIAVAFAKKVKVIVRTSCSIMGKASYSTTFSPLRATVFA